jgi:hypothetical protein
MNPENQQETQPPVLACTLTPREQVERGKANSTLLNSFQQVLELDDGYAFQYPAEPQWIQTLLRFITEERECCRFFEFELRFEPDLGPAWLNIRGGTGVKDLVRDQWLPGMQRRDAHVAS